MYENTKKVVEKKGQNLPDIWQEKSSFAVQQ